MYSVAVLGSSGMIGHEVSKQLITESRFNVSRYQRKVDNEDKSIIHFDIYEQDMKTIATKFSEFDYVVNCTGVIKHLIDPFDQSSFKRIKEVNTFFPELLSSALQKSGTRIIEVGTDCVFSGRTGNYFEDSVKDATDLYGESKRLGEFEANNVMRIRTSVIGLEKDRSIELLSWFLSKRNETVDGFTNHFWNGITSYHLGLLIKTIMLKNLFAQGTQHFFPTDKVTKFDLLENFKDLWSRDDLLVRPTDAPYKVDRTLSSLNQSNVVNLWNQTGYLEIPTIKQLVAEYYLEQK